MRISVNLVLILILFFGLLGGVSANFSGNTIKIASIAEIQEETREEVNNRLKEQQEKILDKVNKLEEEKEELKEKKGFKIIISPVKEKGEIVKLKIEEKLVQDNIERKIKYISKEGNEEELVSYLRLFDYVGQENTSRLTAQLSDKSEIDITVFPESAKEIATERLRSNNISFEIMEKEHKNTPRAVYLAQTNKQGKFLGIFKTNIKSQIYIDVNSGEIIESKKPWWTFLVNEEDN
jgi:apolipoprotein N-acyltransferase